MTNPGSLVDQTTSTINTSAQYIRGSAVILEKFAKVTLTF
jgi:hypothetical protein